MTTRRDVVGAMLAAGPLSALPFGAMAAAAPPRRVAVKPAKLVRPPNPKERAPFIPAGNADLRAKYDYVEEEWFASGVDDNGAPYTTYALILRPRNRARFSGTVILETLHIHRITSIGNYALDYMMRSGHGWMVIGSQKSAVDLHVKRTDPQYYAPLNIEPGPKPWLPLDEITRVAAQKEYWAQLKRHDQASNAILAQAGAAIRAQAGSFQGLNVRKILLVGFSQTGWNTSNFIREAHASHRLAGGAPVFDGYFASGFPSGPFEPRDVPIVQVICEGDINSGVQALAAAARSGEYRRPDSDAPGDRYRLYEFAGVSHAGNSYVPENPQTKTIPKDVRPNDLPHNHLMRMALDHLVQWVAKGVEPPRANRLEQAADGSFARDEHGNTRGGVRCAQMDVPRARYYALAKPFPGTTSGGIPTEVPFDAATMTRLYGTPAVYLERFNRRMDELIRQGWFLADDAPRFRAEAAAIRW